MRAVRRSKEVRLSREVGSHCVTSEDGEKIFGIIAHEVDRGYEVLLDFSGVDLVASPFLNAALGVWLGAMSEPELRGRVHWSNLDPDFESDLEQVLANAHLYFTNQKARGAIDRSWQSLSDR